MINGRVTMLKSFVLAIAVSIVLVPGAAFAKDCMAYCQKVRCTPQNVGGGTVGTCLSKCTAACNAKKG